MQKLEESSAIDTFAITTNEITIENYKARLQLLEQTPYREYFGAFLSTLCRSEQAANIVASGKVDLTQNKREKALSYGIMLAADVGGKFLPTGTIQRLLEDVTGYFLQKYRKQGQAHIAETTANPFHFVLLAQALVDCMLFYFDPTDKKWCAGYIAEVAVVKGKDHAKELIRGIKKKKIAFNEDADLIIKLGACLGYLSSKKIIKTVNTNTEWVEGKYEQILKIATAQTLKLPIEQFTQLDEFAKEYEAKFEELSQKVDQMTLTTGWQKKNEEEQDSAIEEAVKSETEVKKTEFSNTVRSLVGDNLTVAAAGKIKVEHNVAQTIVSGTPKAISGVRIDPSVTALLRAVSKHSANPSPIMSKPEDVVPLLGNNANIQGQVSAKRNEAGFILSVDDDEDTEKNSSKWLNPSVASSAKYVHYQVHTEQVQNKFEVLLAKKGDDNQPHLPSKAEAKTPIRLISNVGEVVEHFQERKTVLENLKKKLLISQVVVLTGVAGCGKTQLATRYLEEFKHEHPESIIWKFRADTSELLKASYEDLALRLGIPKGELAHLQTAQIKNYVEKRLLHWGNEGRECVLFFDNVDDQEIINELKSLLPSSLAKYIKVLITSQNSMFYQEPNKMLYLGDGFTLEEAETFLQNINDSLEDKHSLIKEFSRLPLGLAAARIYIMDSKIPITEYLELLAVERTVIEGYEDKKMQPFYGKAPGQSSQVAAIRLAINKVGSEEPLAKQLLEATAYLSPEGIPLILLQDIIAATQSSNNLNAIRARTNNCVGWLNSYSLIKIERQGDGRLITLHAVTQEAARTQFTPEQRKKCLDIVLQVLSKYLSKDNLQKQSWLTPHILMFIRYIEVINLDQAEKSSLLRSIDRHIVGTHVMGEELTDDELKELIKTLELLLKMKTQCYRTTEHNEIVRTMLILVHFKNMQKSRVLSFNRKILKICNSLINNFPEDFIAYRNRGITHFNLKVYNQVVEDFTRSIQLNPAYSSAYYNRAITYIQLGNIESALNDFIMVIQYDENNYLAHYHCGLINYRFAKNSEALKHFTRTIELNPTYIRAYRCRAELYFSNDLIEQAISDMMYSANLPQSLTIDVLASPLTKAEGPPRKKSRRVSRVSSISSSDSNTEVDTKFGFTPLPASFSHSISPASSASSTLYSLEKPDEFYVGIFDEVDSNHYRASPSCIPFDDASPLFFPPVMSSVVVPPQGRLPSSFLLTPVSTPDSMEEDVSTFSKNNF